MKKIIIGISVVLILIIGYWLISPLFIDIEVDEPIPTGEKTVEQVEVAEPEEPTVTSTFPEEEELPPPPPPEEATEEVVEEPEEGVTEEPPVETLPNVLIEGTFHSQAHHGQGIAKVLDVDGKKYLRFEDFKTDNGPDLKIYLSADFLADDFIDLGDIKDTQGNFNYELPDDIDLEKYNKALVWCKAFGVLFTSAEME